MKPVVVLSMPGSNGSFLTKFLRYRGWHGGNSLEVGRYDPTHMGYLHNDKWHEDLNIGTKVNKVLLERTGFNFRDVTAVGELIDSRHLADLTIQTNLSALQRYHLDENAASRKNVFENLKPLATRLLKSTEEEAAKLKMPWGWNDPRTVLNMWFWKELVPEIRAVQFHRRNVPDNYGEQGPTELTFAGFGNDKGYQELFKLGTLNGELPRDQVFNFFYEDFSDWSKVNQLLGFCGLKQMGSPDELTRVLEVLNMPAK